MLIFYSREKFWLCNFFFFENFLKISSDFCPALSTDIFSSDRRCQLTAANSWYIELTKQHNKKESRMSDVEMNEAGSVTGNEENQEVQVDRTKIQLLPGATSDGFAASFQIIDEDHTLGNALRYMIMKNSDVEFCGYSIPHPSENKLNIRIQTYGKMTAVEALYKGLDDLCDLCTHVEEVFSSSVAAKDYSTEEP